ncbi:FeoB-associated Cys-rich membrane protein [Saccharibacillus sp. CPCC 101409]|uniref:FeoB-associated Cys-rich membrane protein n=1 Tax=Saccharibacillus sp. CPCC 101409 TaxID=3058041 RepID=UPI002671E1D0|nr:FeoB-associated Cys-rich membrane protein [Saccharibacillus sp. CPCC 101409]MDO3408755.1 FeoB-associated Cys-rich membrane protein [Saccharibacillus sp. CPCC 101409]
MINWIIIALLLGYSGYVLYRFWNKSKKGACAGCSVQADGTTPPGCPGCSSAQLPPEAYASLKQRGAAGSSKKR